VAERYIAIAVFFLVSVGFMAVALIAAWILRPHRPIGVKQLPYECGNVPRGDAWVRVDPHFYLIAVLFILFEVEIAFLAPWAANFAALGWAGIAEVFVFVGVLLLGFGFAWRMGDLEW
jgi:NADH-quinone oxidoreductase subunit A